MSGRHVSVINRIIASSFSGVLEMIHFLFLVGIAFFLVAAFRGEAWPEMSPSMAVMIALGAFLFWIVVFGFITTVTVMADTLREMRDQNQALIALLRGRRGDINQQPATSQPQTSTKPREPFVR